MGRRRSGTSTGMPTVASGSNACFAYVQSLRPEVKLFILLMHQIDLSFLSYTCRRLGAGLAEESERRYG